MNNPQEESKALHHRGQWPTPIGAEELRKLKLAIATHDKLKLTSDNSFDRTSEEWIAMEDVLSESSVFVVRQTVFGNPVNRIFVITPSNLLSFITYKFHKEDMSDLEFEHDSWQ